MPIDIRLLAHDEIAWNHLQSSLENRGEKESVTRSNALDRLRLLNHKARVATQEVEQYRSQWRRKQVSDKNCLQALEKAYENAQHELKELVLRIPNYVDLEVQNHVDSDDGRPTNNQPTKIQKETSKTADIPGQLQQVDQLMFCIGGYERLGPNVCALTQQGRDILQSLEHFISDTCRNMPSLVSCELIELPLTLPLDAASHEKRWGAWAPSPSGQTVGSVNAPSWISLVENHLARDEGYFDRSLPQCYLLACRDTLSNNRHSSPPTPKLKPKDWFHNLPIEHQIQTILVTGPSLSVDSRALQLEWMDFVRGMYQNLAPKAHLRIAATPATDLLPTEASRLVLEGYLPQSNNVPVLLAFMSNLLDYCSADLRHGNSIDKRNVHLLHGSVCSNVGLGVEWMLQHCPVDDVSVELPECIRQGERLSFCRRIVKKKGGGQFVQVISKPGSREVAPSMADGQAPLSNDGSDVWRATTLDRIRMEALSCPFDFLPFYSTPTS